MRQLRVLASDVWYEVCTSVNNREPLFWSPLERARFKQALNEAREIYEFRLCGLGFSGPEVSFYIRPADGFLLPEIMQWVKQTYAVRYDVYDGRTGHIWGDRYWSEILPGEPPENAEEYVFAPVVCKAGRGERRRAGTDSGGGGRKRGAATGSPARDAEGRPRTGRRAVKPPSRPD
ncbi:MAG: transposase [Spirochaetaceae bacterium]|nr:transposase [Spirochaetaceae bacterium]